MENVKNSRVLEITSSYVKFAVGYVSNNVPHLLYYKKVPINGLVSDGRIVNKEKLIEVLSGFRKIDDQASDIQMEPNGVSLILPSLGLKVFEEKQASATANQGPNARIRQVDVTYVLNNLKSRQIADGSVLVEVVPSEYIANKISYKEPPLGVQASDLTIRGKLYTLPADILNSYRDVVTRAGFRILNSSVATYCASQLIAVSSKMPKSYILLDIGSSLTTMSLIGENETYLSRFIKSGGNEITNRIAQRFNIPLRIANDLKEKFGYDVSIHKFENPLYTGVDNNNNKVKICQSDLNQVIKEYFDEYLRALKISFNQLEFFEGQKYGVLPILITGGTSRIRGLLTLFSETFGKRNIRLFLPEVIGARDAGASNLLGMIVVESKQKKISGPSDDYRGISSLSRE